MRHAQSYKKRFVSSRHTRINQRDIVHVLLAMDSYRNNILPERENGWYSHPTVCDVQSASKSLETLSIVFANENEASMYLAVWLFFELKRLFD